MDSCDDLDARYAQRSALGVRIVEDVRAGGAVLWVLALVGCVRSAGTRRRPAIRRSPLLAVDATLGFAREPALDALSDPRTGHRR